MNTQQEQGKPRLPLVVGPSNRDETTVKDAKLINGYVEKDKQGEWWVYKRPGLNVYTGDASTSPPTPGSRGVPNLGAPGGIALGIFNWNNDIYTIYNVASQGKMWKNEVFLGNVDALGGIYTFSPILGAVGKLFFHNTTSAYFYDNTTVTQITDANYPVATVPGIAYLDATAYVMTAGAQIQGSNLNDVSVWSALNSLIAQVEPDGGVYLAKQLAYVIAMKQWSTEVFYDAANATGSPLGAVQGAKVSQGCRAAGSVAELAGTIFWVSQCKGSVGVHMMEALKSEEIQFPSVERLLQNADFTVTWAYAFKLDGHTFYIVTMKNSNLTLVYDATFRTWYQWTDVNGNYFPFVAASYNSQQDVVLQHETSGLLYLLDNSYLTDSGTAITCDIYTPNFDGGARTKKFLNRMDFIGDQVEGCTIQIRHNDYDYDPQRWTNFRTVDMGTRRPYLLNEGTFRRRSYHIRHAGATPLRLQAIELDILPGTT